MFSVITNIYDKKTKWPTLMGLFTATGKLKKFYWQLQMFGVCTTGDTAHIDTIFKFLPHTSTWVHWYSSLLQWSVPLGERGHMAMVLCTKCTLHSNHRLTRVIFQHTKRLLPRNGHFPTTYTRIACRQKCELRWKTTYWGGDWVVPSICTGFVNTCPKINFCNPGVHYETPCIYRV